MICVNEYLDPEIRNLLYNIKYLRKANHLSQKEMAKLLGVGAGTISKIEKMQLPKNLGARIIIDLAAIFHVSVDDLMKKHLDAT